MLAEWSYTAYCAALINGDYVTWFFTVSIALTLICSTVLGAKNEERSTEYENPSESIIAHAPAADGEAQPTETPPT